MLEKFNVVKVRFHIENAGILVIQGWKYQMADAETLAVTLDREKLPLNIKIYDGMEVRQRYMIYDLGIEEEYFLYVDLPQDFAQGKELVLWAGEHAVRSFKVSELCKRQRELDLFVEQTALEKGTCIVKGWAAAKSPVKVAAFGSWGQKIPCEISWHERRDVAHVYRETDSLPDAGFEIELPHRGLSKVRLEFASGNRKSSVTVPVISTYLFENVMGSSYLGKGMRFLRQHGFKEFCTRAMQVLMQKSAPQGDYEKYRRAVMPTEEELERQRRESFAAGPLFSIVVPLYRTPVKYLEQLVRSIQSQTYGNWDKSLVL